MYMVTFPPAFTNGKIACQPAIKLPSVKVVPEVEAFESKTWPFETSEPVYLTVIFEHTSGFAPVPGTVIL